MVVPGHSELSKLLDLSDKALGPGLSAAERARWRDLSAEVLDVLSNISPGGSERRRHLRAAAALTVEVLSPMEVRGLVASSISGGGLSMPIEQPPDVGTVMKLSIRSSRRVAPILATAQVVWRHQSPAGALGVAFTEIDERDRDMLEATVIQQLSMTLGGY